MQFVVGSDHAGYEFKERIVERLKQKGYDVKDVGTDDSESTDYPRYAHRVAEAVSSDDDTRGVLVCGSGVGMSIAANRYPGVRGALVLDSSMAMTARKHNDSNCLILGQRLMTEQEAIESLDAFIDTDFEGGRHERRVDKIDDPPLRVVNHPLVQSELTQLRDTETPPHQFRELLRTVSLFTFYEATRNCPDREIDVTTPLADASGKELSREFLLVPIMRAGLGMLEPIHEVVPKARVAHVGLYRDEETLEPVEYYFKTPESLENPYVVILDPMLATGGSAAKAVSLLKERGYGENLRFQCVVAAPEGIRYLHKQHPDVSIYTAAVDDHLDDHGYIVPGLGDAGDRIYGTR